MFDTILIANRGEIAVRVIRACQQLGIRTAAVYSEADRGALHTRLADVAVPVGPAPAAESYLNTGALLAAARQTGAQAIHPGYGFLSEAPAFADAVRTAGLTFIGPPASAIHEMGIKTQARAIMQAAGVPVVPGYQSDEHDPAAFVSAAQAIGYPVMVKAAGGGGGKGIRIVHDPAALPEAIQSARREAEHAFGDPTIFLEKYIAQGHHIEIQVLADAHGHTLHLFERECSVQRRHQKIIEETPSPLLDDDLRARMGQAAVEAARAVEYVNAGTVEFIVDGSEFYFLEMNTRLQVEHPVTEMVTGLDLVAWQIRIAAGEALPFTQADLAQRGHAIECRLYAEDPANNFLPAIGPVLDLVLPEGPGIRVDSGITAGDVIGMHYDPMIAKIVAHGEDREAAIARMQTALARTVILGTTTNLAFLRDVLAHPTFREGRATTRFVDETFTSWQPPTPDLPPAALIAAALADSRAAVSTPAESKADAYSPWDRSDGFRMGGR
ncbi:MAG: acetyl-CoA carboxylase biotin carboxylase subunit [Chloroflexi bacterium]|nr:acetyl-CoA carboxylase biotin carboxylase subunit [Chloroflexota bacterium]